MNAAALFRVGEVSLSGICKLRLGDRSKRVDSRRQSDEDNACCGDKRNETGHGTLSSVDDEEIVLGSPT